MNEGSSPSLWPWRRKANLIIDDYVQRAANPIGQQLAQVERLLTDALRGKSRIPMNQQSHAALAARVAAGVLFRAHSAQSASPETNSQ